jgi:ribose transport system substrate-binding protein
VNNQGRSVLSRRRSVVAVALLCVFAVVLAACGSSSSSSSSGGGGGSGGASTASSASSGSAASSLNGLDMAFANASLAAGQFVEIQNGVKSAAKTVGANLTTYNNNQDATTVLKNAQLISQTKPGFVLEYNPIQGIYQSIQTLFQRASIPCIAINVPALNPATDYCKWFDLSNQVLCGDTAKAIGKVAKQDGWTGKNTTVLLLNAASFGEALNTCNGFFYKELTNWIPGLQKINSAQDIKLTTTKLGTSLVQVNGNAVRGDSFTAAQQALQTIPANRNIVLYTVADDSTLGAWQAIVRAGRASHTLTGGIAGEPTAYAQLRNNPHWVAEGDIFFGAWGEYLMAMAAAVKNGTKTPFQTVSPEAVTTKNFSIPGSIVAPMSDFYHGSSTTPYRLPPLEQTKVRPTEFGTNATVGNSYLAATGVLQKFHNVTGLGAK